MGLNEFQLRLVSDLSEFIQESGDIQGDFYLRVKSVHCLKVRERLRGENYGFSYFVDLCSVDYLGEVPRFEVVVHLVSREKEERIRIKCRVPDETLTLPSITRFWNAANWQEREAYDMYGIHFEGHPKLDRILSAPNVTEFPQRKDYPLKGKRDPGEDL